MCVKLEVRNQIRRLSPGSLPGEQSFGGAHVMLDQRQTLSVEAAAKVLGVGRNTAYEAIRKGELPAIRLGKRLLVPVIALERMLADGVPVSANNSKGETE